MDPGPGEDRWTRQRRRGSARWRCWAPSGSGKTTLTEALLHRAGVLTRAGRVEDGSTVSDHEPEEIARGISLGLGVAPFPWTAPDGNTYDVTLLDAPGSADFAGAVDAALAAADLALIVVSAVDGVQAGTHAAWRLAAEAGLPRMVVVTKEDKARADFRHVLADLRDGVRRRAGPARAAARRGDGVHAASPTCSARRASPTTRDGPPPHRGAAGRASPTRSTGCTTRSPRRSSRTTTTSSSATCRARCRPSPELESTLAHEVRDGEAFPVLVASGRHRRRRRPAGGPAVRARPVARRTGPRACRPARPRSRSPPTRPARRCCTRSGRSPTRSSARSPCSGCCRGTVRPGDRLLNTDDPHRGAHPRAVPAARQGAPAGRRGARRGRSAPSPSSPGPRREPCWRNGPGRARR